MALGIEIYAIVFQIMLSKKLMEFFLSLNNLLK